MSPSLNGSGPPLLPDDSGIKIGVLISHLREEEKLILAAGRERGIQIEPIMDRKIVLEISSADPERSGMDYDVVLDRGVAHSRAMYTLRALETWNIPTINRSSATFICDDKALCSLALSAAGIPTPKTLLAYSVDSALEACETLGYPVVLKPVTGSWGRLLSKANGPDQARVILEQKMQLGSFHHSVFYVQEFLEKPGRDIRVFVVGDRVLAASYRASDHWITNTARGATSHACPITPQIEELSLKSCAAVGARIAGVDLIETFDGYSVVEVNTGGEFHGLRSTTTVDIAAEIVDEAIRIGRKSSHERRELADKS